MGWILGLTAVAFFMVALDALVVITALPVIHRDVGGGLSELEWTVNAYLLAFASFIIPAAAIGDRYGRRRTYVFGLLLFAAASGACALAPTIDALIAARAVQGLGAAIVTPLSLTLLTTNAPPERRSVIIGMWGGIAGLAIAAGPLVGGGVTEGLDWHWIFWVNIPIGVLAAILATAGLVPESRGPRTRVDALGAILVASGALVLLWGIIRGNEAGWTSAEVLSAILAGALLLALFLLWEAKTRSPMLPLGLFKDRTFAAAAGAAFLMMASLFAAAFLAAQYFQIALGDSPWVTGLRFLPLTGTPLIIAPLAGRIADRVGPRALTVTGLTLQALGMGWIALSARTGQPYSTIWPAQVVAGVGISLVLPAVTIAALGAVRASEIGTASGVTNTLQRFGGAFGIAIVGAVFAANGSFASPQSFVDGFRPAAFVAAAFALAGAAVGLAIARPARSPAPEAAPAPIEAF